MVINTVLSVMAYQYPVEKLSVYLSDDGGSELTFYALLEASRFSKAWLPFCKKFKVEPRSPSAYFEETLILIDGRDEKSLDDEEFALPTLVYMAREKRPSHHHNFKAGAMNSLMGLKYGSPVEDVITGLSIQCRGWKSIYFNASRIGFLGVAPVTLAQTLIKSIWFMPFAYVIAATKLYSLSESLWVGYTLKGWWNEQRMWLFKRLASYPFAVVDTFLKLLGINKSAFIVTAKVADKEVSKRYEQEMMEFGAHSLMFTILATIAMLNVICLMSGVKRMVWEGEFGSQDSLLVQLVVCGTVLINIPIYEAMFLRSGGGRMPNSVTITSIALAILAYVLPIVREPLPHTCCRNGRFIPVGGELVRTPGLTLIVPRGTAELYGGRADAAVWGEGVERHTVLMVHGGAG
ncbi:hypothetical protein GW17_00028502 [Ensete ventricosum]|nr:hypothetical protein GW17_00028502 [Ensete ventricosum]